MVYLFQKQILDDYALEALIKSVVVQFIVKRCFDPSS